MILILCVDDHMGLSFAGKRQSRDRVLTRTILADAKGSVLWTDAYSGKLLLSRDELFDENTVSRDAVRIDDDCLARAGRGECCFVEIRDVEPYLDRVGQLVLYHWNRSYPYTVRFQVPDDFFLESSRDFAGYSHETITEEIYFR